MTAQQIIQDLNTQLETINDVIFCIEDDGISDHYDCRSDLLAAARKLTEITQAIEVMGADNA